MSRSEIKRKCFMNPMDMAQEIIRLSALCEAKDAQLSATQQKLEVAEAENAELLAWKESAIAVMPDYQAIAKILGIQLGDSIHDKILPAIEELIKLLAEAKNFDHDSYDYAFRNGHIVGYSKAIKDAAHKCYELAMNPENSGEYRMGANWARERVLSCSPETDIDQAQRFK